MTITQMDWKCPPGITSPPLKYLKFKKKQKQKHSQTNHTWSQSNNWINIRAKRELTVFFSRSVHNWNYQNWNSTLTKINSEIKARKGNEAPQLLFTETINRFRWKSVQVLVSDKNLLEMLASTKARIFYLILLFYRKLCLFLLQPCIMDSQSTALPRTLQWPLAQAGYYVLRSTVTVLITNNPRICWVLRRCVLTLRSTWKVWMDFSRLFIGTNMSCTTWCCSYSFLMASPWVSFNREIFGGTIQPNR